MGTLGAKKPSSARRSLLRWGKIAPERCFYKRLLSLKDIVNLIHRIKSQKHYLRVSINATRPWTPAKRITVVSPGGVATTTLMRHISRFASLNSHADTDGLKHRPKPPERLHDGQRLLFLYGPLNKSIASLERRGWLRIQSAKLGSLIGAYSPRSIRRRAFKYAAIAQIKKFQRAQRDDDKKILCVSFDELWSRQSEIAHFLQIKDARFISEFPARRSREADALGARR